MRDFMTCKHCGLLQHEHDHHFEPVWPSWCKCDWTSWGQLPAPVCDHYESDGNRREACSNCEHNKECHNG